MQHTDMSSSYYQYYQPHFQNPNPIPIPIPNPNPPTSDPQFNPSPTPPASAYASAPPVSSNYSPSPEFPTSNYSSSTYPLYSQPSDHAPTSYSLNPSPASSQPSNQPSYSFPHLEPPSYYPPYDQSQPAAAANYDYPISNSHPGYSYNSSFPYSSASYDGSATAGVQSYDGSFGSSGDYGDGGMYDAGVLKYTGGKSEPYGARGTRPRSDGEVMFDDYGRPISFPSGKEKNGSGSFPKIVKATPKVEEQHDTKGSVLKYRVKLLSEGAGQTDMDVLCEIGLDGIRILDPATNRTLKIYPIECVTRWDVLDSYIFAFWAKSSVDVEPRRIRLKSNSYTTSNILDTVTAASIQAKEIGGTTKPSNAMKDSDQPADKKRPFIDWMNTMKLLNEEKDHWVPDEAVNRCTACSSVFSAFNRKHHCRNCGDIFCDKCTQGRIALTTDENAQPVRVCDQCLAEVTQRLSNTKEAGARVTGAQSHEELVRKLKEEMDKNRKTSSDLASDGFGTRMREVACPTCTVHLQVQVPASGSETIECSVCQHPFLVSAR